MRLQILVFLLCSSSWSAAENIPIKSRTTDHKKLLHYAVTNSPVYIIRPIQRHLKSDKIPQRRGIQEDFRKHPPYIRPYKVLSQLIFIQPKDVSSLLTYIQSEKVPSQINYIRPKNVSSQTSYVWPEKVSSQPIFIQPENVSLLFHGLSKKFPRRTSQMTFLPLNFTSNAKPYKLDINKYPQFSSSISF
ncbi:uncharacterized protein LOC143244468 isoform X1 [Tachypleus tridentatus]|uniref:uncharacterized protein LOC143244468 isoform X1 n=1 Tax=Tachypleus tridentatus TaxID=6853 RepID=UPI003FD370DE